MKTRPQCNRMTVAVVASLAGVLAGRGDLAWAQEVRAAFSTTSDAFFKLPAADQKSLVAAALEHRLQHARNISYEATCRSANHEYKDGEVGKRLVLFNGRHVRHWRLGDRYRVDVELLNDAEVVPNDVKSTQTITFGFDVAKGEGRGTLRTPDSPRVFARVDTQIDPITDENRYDYWLDGKDTAIAQYLIRYLVVHKSKFVINRGSDGLVQLELPWQPRWSETPHGTRRFYLDPVMGFLPTSGRGYRETDGGKHWRMESFVASNPALVGDVWMPTKLRELVGGPGLGRNRISVYDTIVTRIECNQVAPTDVEVTFPNGTEVVDAIKGVFYKVGADGQPTNAERLLGAAPTTDPLPGTERAAPDSPVRRYAFLLSATGGFIVATVLVVRLVRRSKKSSTGEGGPLQQDAG